MQLPVELSDKKIYLLDFNTRGNLETSITKTGFCEQNNWTPTIATKILTGYELRTVKLFFDDNESKYELWEVKFLSDLRIQ